MSRHFRFDEQKKTSLRHKIAEDIRKAILQEKLKPGDRLREIEISEQMGVSRGPIREALRTLEQEGLLISQPYKETMVAEITGEEVLEVLVPIRFTIEKFAIRKALPLIEEEENIKHLSNIVQEMKEGADQNNLYKVVQSDLAFHEYLIRLSHLPSLQNTWTSIYNRILLHFVIQGQAYEDLNELWRDHIKLLDVIKEGNIDRITAELFHHISESNIDFLREHY